MFRQPTDTATFDVSFVYPHFFKEFDIAGYLEDSECEEGESE